MKFYEKNIIRPTISRIYPNAQISVKWDGDDFTAQVKKANGKTMEIDEEQLNLLMNAKPKRNKRQVKNRGNTFPKVVHVEPIGSGQNNNKRNKTNNNQDGGEFPDVETGNDQGDVNIWLDQLGQNRLAITDDSIDSKDK